MTNETSRFLGSAQGAFSFLEVVVALAVVAILASVLLSAHICTVQRERNARALEEARFIADRLRTQSQLGVPLDQVATNAPACWRVEYDIVTTNQQEWVRWHIAPSNRLSQETVVCVPK